MSKKLIFSSIFIVLLFNLFSADFDLNKFVNPEKYNWDDIREYKSYREDIDLRKNLMQIYSLKKMNVRNNLFNSMILPGLGHYKTNNYMKGHVFLVTEIILFGTSLYYYDQAHEMYDKYKNADYIVDLNKYYEAADGPFTNFKIFASLGVLVWIYNVYDTWIVTNEYNNHIWSDLYKNYKSGDVLLTPSGITLRF